VAVGDVCAFCPPKGFGSGRPQRAPRIACDRHLPSMMAFWNGGGGGKGGQEAERGELKQQLLTLASQFKKGGDQEELLETIRALEALNPTPKPLESQDLLSGKYSLLATVTPGAAPERKKRREKEGPVGQFVTELSGASDSGGEVPSIVQQKGNFQDIDLENKVVSNRAVVAIAGVKLEIDLQGSCSFPDAAGLPPEEAERVKDSRLYVAFQRARVTVGGLPPLLIPLGWTNGGKGPEGWLDTTYLDNDVRLGRGDKGSVFVTARRQ